MTPADRLSPEAQLAVITRGTEEILPEGAMLERLRAAARDGRPLRVKQGFDPTAPDIHLGHTVGLRKLREFQDLGHQVVLIVGDYTGMVGDPSGRNRTRPQLTREQVEQNARTYLDQFFRVLERDPAPPRRPVEIHRNGEWFGTMGFMDVMRLAAESTVARVLERDDFAKRWKSGQPISLHELFYPLMQGWDSVEIRADVELGATEQKFNLLVGRALQESHGQPPQIVLTLPVLPGLDGVQRMSKSLGNYVGVSEPPGEMFGKLMSLPDAVMGVYWRLVAGLDAEGEARILTDLADPASHPMILKKRLAHTITGLYHGAAAADRAREQFETQFSRREIPSDLPVWDPGTDSELGIKDLLVRSGLAKSGSDAWRAVEQGAVSIDQVKVADRSHRQNLLSPFVLRLGRRMVRVERGSNGG
jgi:tyrosyl-tRNA synthetase